MVTTRPPKTIVKPTALSPVANTDTKLLIYGLFQKGRVWHRTGSRSRTPRHRHRAPDGPKVDGPAPCTLSMCGSLTRNAWHALTRRSGTWVLSAFVFLDTTRMSILTSRCAGTNR